MTKDKTQPKIPESLAEAPSCPPRRDSKPEWPNQQAMYDMWAKMPFWHFADEGIALSLGKDPDHVNPSSIKRNFSANAPGTVEFERRLDLWQRLLTRDDLESTAAPERFLCIADALGIDCPEDLKKAVAEASKKFTEAMGGWQNAAGAPVAEATPNPRASDMIRKINTRNKVIAAWAKSLGYGSEPSAVGKMKAAIERGGHPITETTLRGIIDEGLLELDEE